MKFLYNIIVIKLKRCKFTLKAFQSFNLARVWSIAKIKYLIFKN